MAANRGGDQVAGFDLRVDVEIGHGGPFKHVSRVGVGDVKGRRQITIGGGQGQERAAMRFVSEQLLDQPAGDPVPVLGQQRKGGELGVVAATLREPGDLDDGTSVAALGHVHQIGDCQARLGGDLAGVQRAHIDVGMLVDHRHRLLGETGPLLGRTSRATIDDATQAEGQERR